MYILTHACTYRWTDKPKHSMPQTPSTGQVKAIGRRRQTERQCMNGKEGGEFYCYNFGDKGPCTRRFRTLAMAVCLSVCHKLVFY